MVLLYGMGANYNVCFLCVWSYLQLHCHIISFAKEIMWQCYLFVVVLYLLCHAAWHGCLRRSGE